MDSAGQGQRLKPKITPKFKLGKNGNIDLDVVIAMSELFKEILKACDNPCEVVKKAQKGIEIFNEWLEV